MTSLGKDTRIGTKLLALCSAMAAVVVLVGMLGLNGMEKVEAGLSTVYRDRVMPLQQLSAILGGVKNIGSHNLLLASGLSRDPPETFRSIAEEGRRIDETWKAYISTYLTPEEKALAETFEKRLTAYWTAWESWSRDVKDGFDRARIVADWTSAIAPLDGKLVETLTLLEDLQARVAGEEHRKAEGIYADSRLEAYLIGGVGLAGSVLLAWVIVLSITSAIAETTSVMGRLALGDTSVEVSGRDRHDEVGDISRAVQVFKDNAIRIERLTAEAEAAKRQADIDKKKAMDKMADSFEADVKAIVEAVASAAAEMEATAGSMSAISEQTSRQATSVAASAEQASANVQTVSAAAEELTSSIAEIGRQVSQAATVSREAMTQARHTDGTVQGLAVAADRIGEVVKLINDIASQTNLLALNATIEAARAGEAGKGFAVVASEVKNLANQTGKATEEISGQIGAVQSATQNAVDAIQSISKTIGQINEIASAIAAAVEEQDAATKEIASNVEQAASGTKEVSSNITGVNQAAGETGQAAGQVLESVNLVTRQSDTLRHEVESFLNGIKAA
ncbi:MAG: MCP four helix bundle domain-containing protein [Alphaproteobacteria bacterium]|nr:MCP four helix bundle domain-containing protein [Alphaproteobacteria bacterium]